MKRLRTLLALNSTLGLDHRMRTMMAYGLAIALGSAVGVPSAWAGSLCPAFDAALLDESFLAWADESGFYESSAPITCLDHPGNPHIAFVANNDDGESFRAVIVPAPWDPTIDYAEGAVRTVAGDDSYWSILDEDPPSNPLSVGEAYVCQAEILRSFTWRQYCRGQ